MTGGTRRPALPGDRIAHGTTATGSTDGRSPDEVLAATAAAQDRDSAERGRAARTADAGVCHAGRAATADDDRGGACAEVRVAGADTAAAAAAAAMGRSLTAAAATAAADDEVFDQGVQVDGRGTGQGDGVSDRGHGTSDLEAGTADGQRARAQRSVMVRADDAAGDSSAAGVGIGAGQHEAALGGSDRTRAADDLTDDRAVGSIEGKDAVVGNGAGADDTRGGAVADAQGSAADRRGARVGIRAGEGEHARTELGDRPGSADNPGVSRIIGTIEAQRAGVGHGTSKGAGRATGTDAQRTRADGGAARVRVVALQQGGTRPELL